MCACGAPTLEYVRRVSSTNVRRAAPADAGAIADVHVRSWQVAYRGLVPDEVLDNLSRADRQSTWQTLLARNADGSFTLVAERDWVVGFCSIVAPSRDGDAGARTCEVAAVYVDPDHWRAGIGSELLVAALRKVAAAGGEDVTFLGLRREPRRFGLLSRLWFVADGAETWHAPSGQKEIRCARRFTTLKRRPDAVYGRPGGHRHRC